MRRFLSNYFDLLFETLLVLVGMGMGRNRDYFTGINGNWTIVEDLPTPGMGMGTQLWEWEGMGPMGTQKVIPAHL